MGGIAARTLVSTLIIPLSLIPDTPRCEPGVRVVEPRFVLVVGVPFAVVGVVAPSSPTSPVTLIPSSSPAPHYSRISDEKNGWFFLAESMLLIF